MRRTKEQREREFAKIFTSKIHSGGSFVLNDRMNGVGRLLVELFVRVRDLERRLENV